MGMEKCMIFREDPMLFLRQSHAIPNGATFYVPRCTQFGYRQPVLYKVCTAPGNPK
jgi:hypothetical protein